MERPSKKIKQISKDRNSDINDNIFKNVKKKSITSRKSLFYGCLIVIAVLLGYQLLFSPYRIISFEFSKQYEYVVIVDAGSTGSRVFVPKFSKSFLNGQVKLEDDLFVYNKPGLSSFANEPAQGAKKIAELLEKAENYIPSKQWKSTPIAVRATAGLRLLPVNTADSILNEVRNLIDQSPFLSNDKSVAIMDGKDEGLFSWFTVNFLLDKLQGDLSKTVLTLDLGGGSVQITFIPGEKSSSKKENKYVYPVSIFNKKTDIYSYSYLGLGLMSGRYAMFIAENDPQHQTVLTSSCVSSLASNHTWMYGGKEYTVRGSSSSETGSENGKIDFVKCSDIIKKIIDKSGVHKPADINNHDIVAFSYFFDRAAQNGLVDSESGGTVTIEDFNRAAVVSCSKPNVKKPFLCTDLLFITYLLKYGFGLDSNKSFQLSDTINGHEISWALGSAFHILENGL